MTNRPLDELLDAVDISDIDEQDQSLELEYLHAETLATELSGRRKFFQLRSVWSGWIIFWISFLVIANFIVAILVGLGVLDFTNHKWFLISVTAEMFLQVVGLGYVAARFLFSNS